MSVEAETAEQAEKLVAEQLTQLVKKHLSLKTNLGQCHPGQALNKSESAQTPDASISRWDALNEAVS